MCLCVYRRFDCYWSRILQKVDAGSHKITATYEDQFCESKDHHYDGILPTSSTAGDATLLVLSSSSALVNQTITISCLFEIGQEAAAFYFPNSIVCIAQYCVMHCGKMSLDCPNNQTYRLNATVSPSWHKKDFFCGHAFGGQRSNRFLYQH